MLEGLFGQDVEWTGLALAVVAVDAVAFVVAEASARLARRVLAWAAGLDTDTWLRSVSSRAPIRAVRLGVFVLVAAALSSPVFDLIGVQIPGMDWAALTAWLLGPGLRVLLVVLLAYLLLRILGLAVERLETELRPDESSAPTSLEDIRRATTLGRLIRSVLSVVIVGVAGLIVLRELQVDIMPILTGAGILGLAVGFGAQTLVKDVIAGFFLILENQV